ncbi:MAG: hypothetical protein U0W40_20585 [Acidimicrobiia bacterium]
MHESFPSIPISSPAADVRREWRADEEEWSRAALEHFVTQRTLTDVLRDLMYQGDAVVLGGRSGSAEGRRGPRRHRLVPGRHRNRARSTYRSRRRRR